MSRVRLPQQGIEPRRGDGPFRPDMRMVRFEDFEAAVALSDGERAAFQRRFSVLFADDARMRRGGLGYVTPVVNALGESYALKVVAIPRQDELEDEDDYRRRVDLRTAAFREEYESHRLLSGFSGFPRLYGYGHIDGAPAMVMEWIEGETLAQVRERLALDASGRLSPLITARIGAELFDVLTRMDLVSSGVVHRDISPSNVMLRTDRLPFEQQVEEGTFDVCLIDFGSSAAVNVPNGESFTKVNGALRMATEAYAPPEMLTSDLPHLDGLRASPAIDVYAAASVLYELACGQPPFDLTGENQTDAEAGKGRAVSAASPFRIKTDEPPRPFRSAHNQDADIVEVFYREPEVAVATGQAALNLGLEPDSPDVRRALMLVDEQLGDMIQVCLASKQRERPTAEAMRDGLEAFCSHYAQNINKALLGEPLIPCMGGSSWLASASPFALRRLVRTVGKSISWGILAVVVVVTGLLVDGTEMTLIMGPLQRSGELSGLAVSVSLILPLICGYVASSFREKVGPRFLLGTLGIAAATVLVFAGIGCLETNPSACVDGLLAALFASATATWCPFVLDYAMAVVPALIAETRRRLKSGREAERIEARPAAALAGSYAGGGTAHGASQLQYDETSHADQDASQADAADVDEENHE